MTTFNILLPWREAGSVSLWIYYGGTTSLSSVLKRRLSFELESLAISADANERLSKYLSEVSRVAALRSQKKDTPQGVLFTNTKLEGSLCKMLRVCENKVISYDIYIRIYGEVPGNTELKTLRDRAG
ncbi:uncharacterized protein LOC113282133 [Papaver somniferum]|uniref:uncharacterized protein LOC113282133 n=1 Tax=Papaver somniferum TaxID=3469 RepID=UPI000E6FEC03|nr:uncharacterized protein LOC113282133 [Papaver somniferum]XP_026386861.1 uncharacterized protein LOC113282133 [Papaver somniferum]